jgi:RNA polymerase sigma-70 factor (ECF subfamily)
MTGVAAPAPVAPEGRQLDPARLGDHVDRLFGAAVALCGSRQEAEDLVQDTLLSVLKRPRIVRGDDDLAYLVRVLRNTFVSRHRSEQRRVQTAPMPEQVDSLATGATPGADHAVLAREVMGAVGSLPPEFRDALVAVDVAGLSCREAAKALGIREGTVMSRCYRARRRLAAAGITA